ncbi:MAG TPA: amidohydrolase family protein [Candidatus Binataceae bacterium]|nr:amidohydrolase family protein [Candidatus Binataceae bacterium]
MEAEQEAKVKALRAKLNHPVIDADGHMIEPPPLLNHYLHKVGGAELIERYRRELKEHPVAPRGNRETGDMRGVWWGLNNDAYDLATVMAPKLLHKRLEEIGIDFAILYPTVGLAIPTTYDGDVRRAACRAINTMNSEICGPLRDRIAPAAVIPMHTPEEAIAELEHAVTKLGFKVAMVSPGVARPIPALEKSAPEAFPYASYFDCFGLDSIFDYDPVWRKFIELGVAVTSHGSVGLRYLPLGRRSPTNYMFNHIGAHAYQQGELCRSIVMGGVPARFPKLSVGFLECGAGWAVDLLHSLEEHWEKRNLEGMKNYDPSKLDRPRLLQLLAEYGGKDLLSAASDPEMMRSYGEGMGKANRSIEDRDEWALCGVKEEHDFAKLFANFFFGCEGDDPSVMRAMDAAHNPLGVRFQAIFSSDIGHWDVPDLKNVLLESHRLADKGLMSAADYRDFVFTYPARLHLNANPDFFKGTVVEGTMSAAR